MTPELVEILAEKETPVTLESLDHQGRLVCKENQVRME